MGSDGLFLIALVIAVGVVGTVVPGLPGLPVAWAAVLGWVLLDDGGFGHWLVLAVVTLLALFGVVAKYVLSQRRMRERGAPRRTLLIAGLGGLIGFFAIPLVGVFLGLAAGALIAEYVRLQDLRAAWSSAWAVLVALGIGTLVEIAAGVAMAAVWGVGVALT